MKLESTFPVKVSVAMVTYNHEKYIAQAIESVLMQQTTFPYEIVIGEDCSTDETREIVASYQAKYPERIRALLHERNLGMHSNFDATLRACRGQYIALLDGDDYWTSVDKLETQTRFLDDRPDCAICFHKIEILETTDLGHPALRGVWPNDVKPTTSIEDLARGYNMPTLSVFFRNGFTEGLPSWIFRAPWPDWPLLLTIAQHGLIGFIDRVMGVYRRTIGSVWSGLALVDRLETQLVQLEVVNAGFNYRFASILLKDQFKTRYRLAVKYFEIGDADKAVAHLKRCVLARPLHRYWKDRLRLLALIKWPWVCGAFQGLKRILPNSVYRPSK